MSINQNMQGCSSKEAATMNSTELSQYNLKDDEINLTELWCAILSGKIFIIVFTFFCTVGATFYALNQPDVYRATTLLAPAGEQGAAGGLAKMAGQFGGLASLAGINLSGGSADKSALALEVLKSRHFLENFISRHKLLVPLMAVKKWNRIENSLIYDKDIYDFEKQEWVRDVDFPKTIKPSNWETFEAFKEIITVSKNKDTGMVTIAIDYYSPELAKQWLLWLVKDINSEMREQDEIDAQNSIDFLSKKLEETQLADMQTVFYQLIEEQTKKIMLAAVSKEYVFKTIDPANSSDNKSKPNRVLIVALGLLFGGLCSIVVVLIRYFHNKGN